MSPRNIALLLVLLTFLSGVAGCMKMQPSQGKSNSTLGFPTQLKDEIAGDKLIVPGVRVGLYRLGDSISAVKRILGETDVVKVVSIAPKLSGVEYDYLDRVGLNFVVDKENKIRKIFIRSIDYRTNEGIGVGSSKKDVLRHFGTCPNTHSNIPESIVLTYPDQGIEFILQNDEVIFISCP